MPVRMQDQSEITQPKYYTPNVKCKTPYQRNIASVPLQCWRDKGHLAFLELINSSLTSNTKYFLSFSDMFCKYVCVYIWNHIHNRFSVTQHLLADVASQTLMFSPKREALTLSLSLSDAFISLPWPLLLCFCLRSFPYSLYNKLTQSSQRFPIVLYDKCFSLTSRTSLLLW